MEEITASLHKCVPLGNLNKMHTQFITALCYLALTMQGAQLL